MRRAETVDGGATRRQMTGFTALNRSCTAVLASKIHVYAEYMDRRRQILSHIKQKNLQI
jgi:hypothetical protein